MKQQVVWAPQPGAQQAYVECPLPFIGFGGARGGGKTDAVLGRFGIRACEDGKRNMVFFRKELPQADDLIERAKEIYMPLGAGYNGMKNQFTFPSGARIRFRPLFNDDDAQKYQGQNLTDAAVEEAGNYPDPSPIMKIFGCLRGTKTPNLTLTFNPGGSGHHWLKEMFIKQAPKGMEVLKMKLPTGTQVPYVYIPSRIQDNKKLLEKDPGYIDRLHLVGSPELVRAWLEGDFEIHEGSHTSRSSGNGISSSRFQYRSIGIAILATTGGFVRRFARYGARYHQGKMTPETKCRTPKVLSSFTVSCGVSRLRTRNKLGASLNYPGVSRYLPRRIQRSLMIRAVYQSVSR
jgi:hypothetical protein